MSTLDPTIISESPEFIVLLIALTFLTGCWTPALQLAPMAVQATEVAGMGAAAAVTKSAPQTDRGEDEGDRRERCEALESTPPALVELRMERKQAQLQWRELELDDSSGEPLWTSARTNDRAQWFSLQNLNDVNFTPPLELAPKSIKYLAYAPAEPRDAQEDSQLDGFQAEFEPAGTFKWRERVYEYALVPKLPCFPLSAALR